MTSSRPYQSQVFRFLQKQSRRLTESYSHAWRKMSLGMTWGAQIVLYPVYALFQSTRLVGRQLEQTRQKETPKLPWFKTIFGRQSNSRLDPPPSAEDPILRILEEIQQAIASSHHDKLLQSGKEQVEFSIVNSAASKLYLTGAIASIQGVAAQLDNRSLVLVAADNTILDILPHLYQQELRRQISRLVADYWYQWRQARKHQRSKVGILSLPTSKKGALLSVQLFRQVMAWVQTGPIAVSTNLFREAELVTLLNPHHRLPDLSFPTLPAAVYDSSPEDFRGAVFAALRFMANQFSGVVTAPLAFPNQTQGSSADTDRLGERRSLKPANAIAIPSFIQDLPANVSVTLRFISSQLASVAAPAPLALSHPTQGKDADAESPGRKRSLKPFIASAIANPLQNLPTNVFAALRLISSQFAAAVTPGPLTLTSQTQGKSTDAESPGRKHSLKPLIASAIANPLQNLQTSIFGALRLISSQLSALVPEPLALPSQTQGKQTVAENSDDQRPGQSGGTDTNSVWKTHLSDRLGQLGQSASSTSQILAQPPQLRIVDIDLQIGLEEKSPDLSASSAQAAAIGQDWIDAQATFVEYLEHPLEKLLRWLDQAMLVMEKWVLQLIQISKRLHRP